MATGAPAPTTTATPVGDYRLDQTLPAEVLVGRHAAWSRYRQYPVFSAHWLRGRTLVFAAAIFAFAGMSYLGMAVPSGNYRAPLLAAAYQFGAFLLMTSAGPAMATAVRHRRWPESRERVGVVLAWLLGVVLAYFVDSLASTEIMRLAHEAAGHTGNAPEAREAALASMPRLALAFNLLLLAVIYGLLGGGLALRAYFGERRRWEHNRHQRQLGTLAQQKREVDMRLGVLQAQVEPHFLFNTLASVRALVRRDPERAERTLDALVDHLRATIPKMRGPQGGVASTLGQQLDICASYLEVMRLRTADRLSYRIDADAALRALAFPPLLLITLVENAVKHGVEPKAGPASVLVRARLDDASLRVDVIDDGVGMSTGIGNGMGLANVRAQLQARYGDRASCQLSGRSGAGAQASLVVPLGEEGA